jgi:hypothetical protein
MERGLLLTDDYLFDVFWLDSSAGQRTYDWQVQSPATAKLTDGWQATDELDGGVLYKGSKFERKAANGKQDLTNVHKHEPAEGDWHAHLQFSATTDDVTKSPIAHFTNRGIGVRVHLLGEPGTKTIAYAGSPPGFKAAPDNPTTLIARRQAEDTTFVALHDHFDNGKPRVDKFQRITGNDRGMFVRITGANGAAINDRIAMAVGDGAADQPITLQGDGESITFTDHAWVRIDGNQVEALGNISALSVKLPEIIGVIGSPALHLNGKKVDAKVTNNVMTYQK